MENWIVEVDIHGCTSLEAETRIDNALKRAGREVYRIRVIHGYRNGQVLLTHVRRHYRNHPKVKRILTTANPGETDLVLRELY